MKPEDFIGSEVFWAAAAVVVALSVAIGSLITLGINALTKYRERPEADWAVDMHGYALFHGERGGQDAGFYLSGRVSNVGDGNAFHVKLAPTNAQAYLEREETRGMPAKAFAPPGSVMKFEIYVPLEHWDTADVRIQWTVPPTRLKKRASASLSPKDYMNAPGEVETDPETGKVTQRYMDLSALGSSH